MYADQVFTSLLSVEQALDFGVGGAEVVDPTETGSGSLAVSFGYNAADSRIYGVQVDGGLQLPRGFNLDWTALCLEAEIEEALAIRDFRFQAAAAPEEAVFRSIDGHRLPHTPRFRLNASLSQSFRLSALVLDYVVSIGWRSEEHRTIFNGRDFLQPDDPRLRLDDLVESFWSVDAGAGATWNQGPDRGFRQQRDRRGA